MLISFCFNFEDDKKDAGEIGAGHTVTALYELIPQKENNQKRTLVFQQPELTEQAKNSTYVAKVALRYKKSDQSISELEDFFVDYQPIEINNTSDNLRFSAAVAQFGMLLKKSEYKKNCSWHSTIELAKNALGEDQNGYRREMIRLIESMEVLADK